MTPQKRIELRIQHYSKKLEETQSVLKEIKGSSYNFDDSNQRIELMERLDKLSKEALLNRAVLAELKDLNQKLMESS